MVGFVRESSVWRRKAWDWWVGAAQERDINDRNGQCPNG
jgi:hypothetical protein